jgi:hypothetical protein
VRRCEKVREGMGRFEKVKEAPKRGRYHECLTKQSTKKQVLLWLYHQCVTQE